MEKNEIQNEIKNKERGKYVGKSRKTLVYKIRRGRMR